MTTSFRPSSRGIAEKDSASNFVYSGKLDPGFANMRPGDSACAILFYDPAADLDRKNIPDLIIHSCDRSRYNCRVALSYRSLPSIVADEQITCVAYTDCPLE